MTNLSEFVSKFQTLKHPMDDNSCINRLIDEYHKHGKLVIGFDFDNTIFDVHNRGGDYSQLIGILQECKKLGFILCLYTAELRPEWLNWKIKYCKHFEIEPDYVNVSPLLEGTDKPFFNLLLDDRASIEGSYYILYNVIYEILNTKTEEESL